MYSKAIFEMLFAHMQWADAEVWKVVCAHSGAEADKKLKAWLYHIHLVQRAFYQIWMNLPMDFPEEAKFATLLDVARWGFENAGKTQTFLKELDEKELDRVIEIPWAGRFTQKFGKSPGQTRLAETMLQVALHSQHHRGQVNSRLRELGAEPPLVDWIAWLWFGKPKPDWPEEVKSMNS